MAVNSIDNRKVTPRLREKMKLCAGCRANRYNMGKGFQEGPNDAVVTSSMCWSLPSATKVKKRIVSISQTPPWTGAKRTILDCWSASGYFITDREK